MKKILLFLLCASSVPFGHVAFGQKAPEPIANPAGNGSLQPDWSVTQDGSPLLSWIEKAKDGSYTLKYAIRHGAAWSEPRTVAAGRHFFRHPAEVPEVITLPDGTFMAHWIETPKEESEAEFAYVSASHDGVKWTVPALAHKDRSQVQHGLASMAPSGDHEASLIWLEALHGEDEPVAMKRTIVSAAGAMVKEEVLDPDVCGCCPTTIVKTTRGLLIAYRAHTKADIRDIATIRYEDGKWTPMKILSADGWKIDACPTNAAAVSAKGDRVAISWFTGAQDNPRTQIAFSNDAGVTFGKPVLISSGHSYGYTSVALDENGGAMASWLEEGGSGARLLVRHVTAAGVAGPVIEAAKGSKQSLGYPKLLRAGAETWIAWGSGAGDAKVQTARVAN
jgi:BNR repeat-like domain